VRAANHAMMIARSRTPRCVFRHAHKRIKIEPRMLTGEKTRCPWSLVPSPAPGPCLLIQSRWQPPSRAGAGFRRRRDR
jgi:hypothetical protein